MGFPKVQAFHSKTMGAGLTVCDFKRSIPKIGKMTTGQRLSRELSVSTRNGTFELLELSQ
jgi:hypothetical protein